MNIRQIARRSPNYCEINREERNYASILFSVLCKPGNLENFIETCGIEKDLTHESGIYFEYSYLRDLWKEIQNKDPEREDTKKNIIRQHLNINRIDELLALPTVEFNRIFGVPGRPSKRYIQYPGNWSIIHFNNDKEYFSDPDDFWKVCKFKWSFNIKPDIVVHLDKDNAVCIEAKHESGEGSYPYSGDEKRIFEQRGIKDKQTGQIKKIGQIDLQVYMMEELLGVKIDPVFLVSKRNPKKEASLVSETGKNRAVKIIDWGEAFGCLDLKDLPNFAVQMIDKISDAKR